MLCDVLRKAPLSLKKGCLVLKKKHPKRLAGWYTPYVLIALTVIMIIAFKFYPLILNVWYSLIDYKLSATTQEFVGLKNYIEVLTDKKFVAAISRTFTWTCLNIVGMLALGIPAAFLLNTEFKGKILLKSCILIPWVLPEIVTGYTWKWMLMGDFGIINLILSWFNIIPLSFSWFRSGNTAMAAVVMANVWRSLPFVAVMTYAKLKTLPTDIEEAARIDGANGFNLIRYITIPYIMPVLKRVITLGFVWTFNAFSIIYSMTGGGPVYKTEIMPLIVQRTAFTKFEFSEASAMSITMSLILLIFMAVFSIGKKIVLRITNKEVEV